MSCKLCGLYFISAFVKITSVHADVHDQQIRMGGLCEATEVLLKSGYMDIMLVAIYR